MYRKIAPLFNKAPKSFSHRTPYSIQKMFPFLTAINRIVNINAKFLVQFFFKRTDISLQDFVWMSVLHLNFQITNRI